MLFDKCVIKFSSFYVLVMSSYDKLRAQKIVIGPIVEWHFKRIMCAIKRKLRIKQTFRDPYKFNFTEPIPLHLFRHIYNAINPYEGETTPPSIVIETATDKPGRKATKTNWYKLKIVNFYSALHLFTHTLGKKSNILDMFKKTVKK